MSFKYTKIFDPYREQTEEGIAITPQHHADGLVVGDVREKPVYVYTDEIILAVNVAIVTGRPLLLRGAPGCGKSTLARHVAWKLGWKYYQEVITSRTQARDLEWRFDSLRRLQDSQVEKDSSKLNPIRYVNPGILWWALDPESAMYRGITNNNDLEEIEIEELKIEDPAEFPASIPSGEKRAVVLLDEIDKADPDVPNNLLEVVGSLQFRVEETGKEVKGQAPLIFITTNGERELPAAFLRRCLVIELQNPDLDRLVEIAKKHFKNIDKNLIKHVSIRWQQLGREAREKRVRQPSTAEFLDTIRACLDLGIDQPNEAGWKVVTRLTLWKQPASSSISHA